VVLISFVFGIVLVYLGMKVPMVWTIARFGYSNALFNSRVNRFARRLYMNNLFGTNSFGEAVNFVSSASPRDFPLKNVTTVEDAEQLLFNKLFDKIEEAKTESPKFITPVLDTFIIKYENRVLKALFRQRMKSKVPASGGVYPVGGISQAVIDRMRAAETVGDIVRYIPREELASMLAVEDLTSFRNVESALDRFYIRSIETSFQKLPRTIRNGMREFLEVQIDVINVKMLIRMINLGIPEEVRSRSIHLGKGKNIHGDVLERLVQAETMAEGVDALGRTPYGPLFREVFKEYKESGNISRFELELDRFWLQYVESFAMKMNTTVGPVIRYFVELEYEIRNIMAVLRATSIPGGKEMARSLIVCREAS